MITCERGVVVNYDVTDEQLLEFGISQRIITLSKQWYMREGQIDFDIQYALSILDAQDNVSLAALAINNPDVKSIRFPIGNYPYMGLVRHNIS